MKHFSIGLAIGAGFGVVLSLFKDKNGKRLFPEVQKGVNALKADIQDLSASQAKLKTAQQDLKNSLPQAKKAISELQNELEYYQISVNRIIHKLKAKTATFQHNDDEEMNSSKN